MGRGESKMPLYNNWYSLIIFCLMDLLVKKSWAMEMLLLHRLDHALKMFRSRFPRHLELMFCHRLLQRGPGQPCCTLPSPPRTKQTQLMVSKCSMFVDQFFSHLLLIHVPV